MIKLILNKAYEKETLITMLESNNEPLLTSMLILVVIMLILAIILFIISVILVIDEIKIRRADKTRRTNILPLGFSGVLILIISFGLTYYFLGIQKQTIELSKADVNSIIKEINDQKYDKVVLVDDEKNHEIYIDNFLYISLEDIKEGKFKNASKTD